MVEVTKQAILLLVKDVFESAEWYRDVLGFKLNGGFAGDPPSFCIVERDAARLFLRQPRNGEPPRRSNTETIPDFCDVFLNIDEDIDGLAEEIGAKGAQIVMPPTYRPIWNGKEMYVKDPSGWVIGFGQPMD